MMRDNKGIVLTMVLYIIIIFVVIGLVLVTLMMVSSQSSYQLLYSTQAYYLSEAGLEYGLYQIKDDPIWNDGTPAPNLATGITFTIPNQVNCSFSLGFTASGVQNGTLISVGSLAATQVFSLDKAPAQRVVSMSVPRIY
jgi:Tfp pilus assembly protein PilX